MDRSSWINSKLLLSLYRLYADVFFQTATGDDNKTELPEDKGGEETAGSRRASAHLNLPCCIKLTFNPLMEIRTRFSYFTMRSGVAHLSHTSPRIVIKDSLFRLFVSEYNSDFDFSYSPWSWLLIWSCICVAPLVLGGRMNSRIWFCPKKERTFSLNWGSCPSAKTMTGCLVLISFRWRFNSL